MCTLWPMRSRLLLPRSTRLIQAAPRLLSVANLTCALLLTLLACSKSSTRPKPGVESPTAVIERFRAAWIQRDTSALRSCLAPDFSYGSACTDSDGNFFLDLPLPRDSILIAAARLFRLGGAGHHVAQSIDVAFGPLEVQPTPMASVRYRDVFTTAIVVIRSSADTLHLGGFTGFRLARGDASSATLTDSTRWFIETWMDVAGGFTAPSGANARVSSRVLESMRTMLDAGESPMRALRRDDSAECDSLVRRVWGYSLRRYLETP
jgi:hypothetical protein